MVECEQRGASSRCCCFSQFLSCSRLLFVLLLLWSYVLVHVCLVDVDEERLLALRLLRLGALGTTHRAGGDSEH